MRLSLAIGVKKAFVVIDFSEYKKFREYQLQKAYEEVMKDVKSGDYEILTPQEHIAKLKEALNIDV